MKKSTIPFLPFLFFLTAFTFSFSQSNAGFISESPQAYYVSYAGIRGMMYAECYEWNAIAVFQKRYHILLGEFFAGCIPTEETVKSLNRMEKQNVLVNQQFRQAGILAEGTTLDSLIWEEFKRQKQIDGWMRQQAFFQEKEKVVQRPIFIESVALEDINQYEVYFYQEDRRGEMWRFMKAFIDLSTSEVRLLESDLVKQEKPWNCWMGTRDFEEPCNIIKLTAGAQSRCDPATNTYSQELIIDHRIDLYPGHPIKVNNRLIRIDDVPGPQKVILDGLIADGKVVDISILNTQDRNEKCKEPFIAVFIAPAACKNKQIALPAVPQVEEIQAAAVSMDIFPNPTAGSSTIRIELLESSQVKLSVFNLAGQLVRQLFSGKMEAGTHQWSWDGLNESGKMVSKGIYIVRLTIDEKVLSTQKLMILD